MKVYNFYLCLCNFYIFIFAKLKKAKCTSYNFQLSY